MSLADSQQWLEVRRGERLAAFALPREAPLWDETLAASDVLEIADMNADPRLRARAGMTASLRSYVGTPLRDATGDVVGTLCAFDVKPRTLSARRLRALRFVGTSLMTSIETRGEQTSEDLEQIGLLGSALDLVADPIAICRIPEPGAARQLLTFVYVNRAFVDLFGYASDEILGRTPATLRGPLTEPDVVREFVRAVHTGAEAFGEVTYHSATGEPRIVQVRDRRLGAKHRICSFRDFTRERTAEAALEDTHVRLQALLKTNSDAVFTLDRSGACVDANPAAEALLGYAHDELLGDGFAEAAREGLFPEGERFPERLCSGESFGFAKRYRHRSGRAIAVDCKAIPMVVRGATEGAYVLATDVTERRRLAELAERQARRAQDLCNVAAATEGAEADRIDSALALVMLSFAMQNAYVAEIRGTNIYITNRIGERLFDVGGEIELARTRADELLALGDVLTIDDLKTHPVINDGIHFDGNWHAYICAPLHVDGKLYGFMGFLGRRVVAFDEGDRDFVRLAAALVSAAIARRVHGVRLDRMAYVDGLTELPNRAHFTRELARATTCGTAPFALLFADLDGFKLLNDRAGHAIGDLALREVGRRIAALCGPAEVPARLGGDEFVILQRENPGRARATAFGNAIVEALSAPYVFEGQTFEMGASVGIAFSPDDGTEADTLMRAADAALYRAKTSGKHRVEVTPQ